MKQVKEKISLGISTFVIFLLAFLTYFHEIAEFSQDLGRHILLGQIIWQINTVPKINLLSYTYPNFPFINNDWLSEVVFYLLYHIGGINALFYPLAILVAAAFALFFLFLAKRTSFFAAFVGVIVMLTVFAFRALLRPEIFSYLFTMLFLVILYTNKKKPTKWLFVLPLIELFWVNMHITFPVGYGLVGIFLTDNLFTANRKHKKFSLTLCKTKSFFLLCAIFIACLLVTLANPHGLSGALYPFTVFSNYGYPIAENASLSYLLQTGYYFPAFTPFFIFLAVILVLLLLFWRKIASVDVLLFGIFTFGALSANRNLALFAIGALPIVTQLFQYPTVMCAAFLQKRQWSPKPIAWLLGTVGTIIFLVYIGTTYGFGLRIGQSYQAAGDFFLQNISKGPIFNNFDIGSYLDYRLYPQKVFVDGRPEAYPASFFQNVYIPMQENPKVFAKEDNIYHFNSIIFSYLDQTPWAKTFLRDIVRNKNWSIVYLDYKTVILVKNTAQNQQLIKKFGMKENAIKIANEQHYTPQQLLQVAVFFQNVSFPNDEIATMQLLLAQEPTNCTAISQLTQLYANTNNLQMAQIYGQKEQLICQ